MNIWIAFHPLTWRIWPIYDPQGEYNASLAIGPISINWYRK